MNTTSSKISTIKQNNISSKMLQARMIRSRRSLSYNRPIDNTYYNIILEGDEGKNKSLLLSLKYNIYIKYYTRVFRSEEIFQSVKYELKSMLSDILANLTDDEEKTAGLYQQTIEDTAENENDLNKNILEGSIFTFYCYMIHEIYTQTTRFAILNYKRKYRLTRGKKYIFNLEDPTNMNAVLSFSNESGLYIDVENIQRIGKPGYPGAFLVFTAPLNSSYSSIHIYNKADTSHMSSILFGSLISSISIESPYLSDPNRIKIKTVPDGKYNTIGFSNESVLTEIYKTQSHYMFMPMKEFRELQSRENDLSIETSTGGRLILSMQLQHKLACENNYAARNRYALYYGHYSFHFSFDANHVALINGGFNSNGDKKSSLIEVVDSEIVVTKYLSGMDEDGETDGMYDFYKGTITIRVAGDFEKCSLYTLERGYNGLEDVLIFDKDKKYAENSTIKPNGYLDIKGGYDDILFCLHPETIIHFHDISVENKEFDTPIQNRFYMSFNYNETQDYYDISQNKYGMCNGQYLIKNVPKAHAIAIINREKQSLVKYKGSDFLKKRLGPDGNLYDFFYGTIIIEVLGDFGCVSVFEYNDGFCGGYNILVYSNNICSDVYDELTEWSHNNGHTSFNSDSITDISIPENDESVYQVQSYIKPSFKSNKLFFDDVGRENISYGFNNGIYVLLDVPKSRSIAFLNHGLTELFHYDGYYPNRQIGIAPDGNYYDFYYGNINIHIQGDFGTMSIVTLNDGLSIDGFRKIIYNRASDIQYGRAIPHYGPVNNEPILESSVSGNTQIYNILISI